LTRWFQIVRYHGSFEATYANDEKKAEKELDENTSDEGLRRELDWRHVGMWRAWRSLIWYHFYRASWK
jgi:hypothetical protein